MLGSDSAVTKQSSRIACGERLELLNTSISEPVIQQAHRFLSVHDDSHLQGHAQYVVQKDAEAGASYWKMRPIPITFFGFECVRKCGSVTETAGANETPEGLILLLHVIEGPHGPPLANPPSMC